MLFRSASSHPLKAETLASNSTGSKTSSYTGSTLQDVEPITLEEQRKVVSGIFEILKVSYMTQLGDGETTENELKVLSEVLSRVNLPTDETLTQLSNRMSPRILYSWALPLASIVWPYFDLKEAADNLITARSMKPSWGLDHEGVLHLPAEESMTDSPAWAFLISLVTKRGFKVKHDLPISDEFPMLDATDMMKDPILGYIFIRILELEKSPFSATISRAEDQLINIVKNAVDFVILSEIYEKLRGDYSNLTISGKALSRGRRSARVENKSAKGKAIFVNVSTGYKLSTLISRFTPRFSSSNLEEEPFMVLIIELIRGCIPQDLSSFDMPKGFFEAPSDQLRSQVRQGPQIKTKRGMKHNLYVPFSFVKSSDCEEYSESARRDAIEVSSKILRNLDHINSFSVKKANEVLPFYKEYLRISYVASDTCRKAWQRDALVPSTENLRTKFLDEFEPDKEDFSWDIYLQKLRVWSRSIPMVPVSSDKAVISRITESIRARKDERRAPSTQMRR